MCFKKKKKTTTVQTQAPQQVQDFYNATADATKKAAAKQFVSYGTQASDYVAPLTEQQKAGMAGVNATVGAYKPLMQAGVNATNAGLGYMGTGMGVAAGGLNSMGAGMNTIGQGLGVAGSGLSNMNAGSNYIGQGMGSAQKGMGTVGRGIGAVNQGFGVVGSGLSNIDTGSNYVNQGVGAVNQGQQYLGQGYGTVGRGANIAESGLSNINTGENYVNQGMGTVGQGTQYIGQGAGAVNQGMGVAGSGLSNINTGSDYINQGMGTVGQGTQYVGQGMNAANQGMESINQGTEATQAGMGPANLGSLDVQKYLSPYLSEVRDSTAALMNQANNQAQSQALGTAISSGAFGGDRAGIAAANLNQQNQLAMGNTMANIGNQGYQFATTTAQGQQTADLAARQANLQRMLDAGAQFGQLGATRGQLGATMGTLGAQQGELGTAMGNLGAQQGTLGTQRAQIGTAIGNMGAQLGTLGTQQGELGTAMGNLGAQQGTLGTQRGQIGTAVGNLGTAQANIGAQQGELGATLGNLGAQQGTLGTQRGQLGTAMGNMGAQLGTLGEQQGGLGATMGNLGAQQTAVGSAKGTLGTQIGQMGTAQANIGEQQGNLGNTMSNIGSNVVGAGKQLAGFGTEQQRLDLEAANAQMNSGAVQQQNQQAGIDAMINRFMQEQGYDFQTAQFLANQYATIGPLYGSTTSTTRPTNIFGNPVKTGGRVNGYAKGGGIAGPMTMSQMPLYEESYIPERIFSASPLLTGQEAEQTQKKEGNFISDALKIASYFGGKAEGGAVDQRHGYALDGGVSYPARTTEELRREQEIRRQMQESTGIIGDLDQDALLRAPNNPANMGLAGHAMPPSPTAVSSSPQPQQLRWYGETENGASYRAPTTENLRSPSFEERRDFSKKIGHQNDAYLASSNAPLTPANMGRAGRDMPPSPTTGVAAASDAAPITPMRPPPPRPEGLGAADVTAEIPRPPPPRPEGLGAADVAADAMRTIQVEPAPFDGLGNVKPVHIPTDWDAAKAKIIPRESGNDPNALLGFANREGGAFAGTNITDMTVNQAIEFARVGGPYANYSKTQTEDGRVATPMGLYQIVGSTLADAKNAMGLTGDEKMTPELQESIAKHLYDTRGMQPWAASEGKTGGLGDARMPPSDGLARADMTQQGNDPLHINKPYEDRNLIGKFFHDPNTGKLDRNAVMSLLSGIGGMVSSDSMSPLTALLQGAAVGSNTYKDLLKQSAEVSGKNIENLNKVNMDTMLYNETWGTNMTPEEYARMMGIQIDLPSSESSTSATQSTSGKMTLSQYQNGTVNIDGRNVRMQDDPVSIQKFIDDNGMFPAGTPIGDQVQTAQDHLNAIKENGGMTVDSQGQQFQIKGYTGVGDVQEKAKADREAAANFREEAQNVITSSAQQLGAIKTLEGVYTKMEPGKFANVGAETSAVMSALDPNNITGWGKYDLTNPAQYEIAMKGAGEIMANRLRTLPGGAPAAEIDMLSSVTPTPNMQPAAVKKLLAITKAEAKYRLDMYNNYDPAIHGNDVNAYIKNFADGGKKFTQYVDDAMASMPKFAGEGIEPSEAEAELIRRGYKQDADGKWSKP